MVHKRQNNELFQKPRKEKVIFFIILPEGIGKDLQSHLIIFEILSVVISQTFYQKTFYYLFLFQLLFIKKLKFSLNKSTPLGECY
jgi:hypothetical protein